MNDPLDSHLRWQDLKSQKVVDCHIFDYCKVDRQGPEGQIGTFTVLDAPDWITVVAPISQNGVNGFLMVKQFRHGSGSILVEFPAGVVESKELPIDAARRELEEETGWRAGQILPIGSINPNPAFMNNKSHFFVALDLKKVGAQNLDENEALDALFISEKEVKALIGTAQFNNGIMVIAWFFYLQWKENNK